LADSSHSFNRDEIAPVIIVSLISALRLLGIFLILPIFSAYAVRYPSASAALAGVAFGIYALAQCIFQIPLGWASDRWGRKPVLIIGLALFCFGSVGCALAESIGGLILARALQGTGAVGSVAFAALADLTRPSVRAQAYTITGIAIGASFMIGLLAGPFLAAHIGLSGLFYVLALLGLLSLILAACFFPPEQRGDRSNTPMTLRPILMNSRLRPIFVATFALSFALNLFFFTYPLSWAEIGFDKAQLWKVYSIIFLPSVLLVFPYMRRAEKAGRFRRPPVGRASDDVVIDFVIGEGREEGRQQGQKRDQRQYDDARHGGAIAQQPAARIHPQAAALDLFHGFQGLACCYHVSLTRGSSQATILSSWISAKSSASRAHRSGEH